MYPQMNTDVNYDVITDMKEDNKRLCKDLCKVSICLTCFCILYLFFFLKVIDDELNINNTMIT